MGRLKDAILLAADIREGSWDHNKKAYTKTLRKACDMAAKAVGYDERGTEPIFLLLHCAWNDSIAWAKSY